MTKEIRMLMYTNILLSVFCFFSLVILFSQTSYLMGKVMARGDANANVSGSSKGANIENVTVEAINGERSSLRSILKKKTYIYVWKPSCPYCRMVMDEVEKNYKTLDGAFLSLSMKAVEGDKKEVIAYQKEHKMTFPIFLLKENEFFKPFSPYGIPVVYEVKNGKIQDAYEGVGEVRKLLNGENKNLL